MDETAIPQLVQYLGQTLDPTPQVRRKAEEFLESMNGQPGWAPFLLMATTHGSVEDVYKLQSSITFKNLIRKCWAAEDGRTPFTKDDGTLAINEQDRVAVKTQVVDIMVRAAPPVQKQISQAIAIIGAADFPDKWPQLVPYMIEQFKLQDFNVITGVLQTAHTLFEKYRHAFASNELFTEILGVLQTVAAPLTELFTALVELTKTTQDVALLKTIFQSLTLIAQIFYSLNYQDLPEFFEDNMQTWFTGFHSLLSLPMVPALASDDDDRPGVMEELKAEIVESIALYTMKYDEEMAQYVQPFVEICWGLLVQTGQESKYDHLISVTMKFLAYASKSPTFKHLFAEEATLKALCEKVVVPNVMLRTCDEEVFEDDADEYIRIDIEGSDVDTRRRGATDLVRGLCTHFEAQIFNIFSGYIQTLLQQYQSNPQEHWKSKDAATFLITSLVVKGEVQGKGATVTSDLMNVMDYFAQSILPDLQSSAVAELPVLKADAIKFVMTFRNLINKEQHLAILPMVANHLTSPNQVVCSYAAACIERCFVMKVAGSPLYTPAEVGGMAEVLFTNLFQALQRPENSENEYIMKAILKTLAAGKDACAPLTKLVTQALSQKMMEVAKNPGKAGFYHYMFEAMCCAIRYGISSNPVSMFEEMLFPSFQIMLTGEVIEFQPYVFQLMAQMLEAYKPGSGVSGQGYQALFPMLLVPALWESGANSSPLVRLLQAYVLVGGQTYVAPHLDTLLGIFHKLIGTKAWDHEGFNLITSLIDVLPVDVVSKYIMQVFQLCFTRLSKAKTLKFMRSMLHFVCVMVGKYGGSYVISQVDQLQAGAWQMLMNRLLGDVDAIVNYLERKSTCIGLTKLLTETPEMHTQYSALWPLVINALVRFIELESDGGEDEESQLAELEKKGYQAAFVKLAFSGTQKHDPFGQIKSAKGYLVSQLTALEQQHPGQLQQRIPAEVMQHIQKYMQQR